MKLFTSFHENQDLLIIENEHVLSNNNYTQFNNNNNIKFRHWKYFSIEIRHNLKTTITWILGKGKYFSNNI